MLPGRALDHVLVDHHLVGHGEQRAEPHVDLRLAGGAHLVVLDLDVDPHLDHREDHFGADVLVLVHRGDGEVAFLIAGPVAAGPGIAGPPDTFRRVDVVVALVLVLVEAGLVEDVELELGAPVRRVGDAGGDQALLGLLCDVAGVS